MCAGDWRQSLTAGPAPTGRFASEAQGQGRAAPRAAQKRVSDEVGRLWGIHCGEPVGDAVDECVEDRTRRGRIDVGAQMTLIASMLDEGAQAHALRLCWLRGPSASCGGYRQATLD
jgi:hypothetical protein